MTLLEEEPMTAKVASQVGFAARLFGFVRQHPLVTVGVGLLVLVACAATYALLSRQAGQARGFGGGAVLVAVAQATQEELIDEVESVGTARAKESVTITSKVTETVSKILFEDGDWVEKGDILVELTNTEQTALLAEAQATVEEATRQHKRVENLIDQRLASETELDAERARMDTAQARLDAIVARLDDRLIRAPFSGLLGFRHVSPGTLLDSNTAVTTLDDISLIKLDFSVPEKYLDAIKLGQQVYARSTAYPGETFTGAVQTVGSRVDSVTRSVTIRAHLANDSKRLRPGMLLSLNLVLNRPVTLVVPEEAIIPVQQTTYVFAVDAENKAQRKEVLLGRRAAGKVEVLQGLQEGDRVVTQGIIKLSPGALVQTREAEGAANTTGLTKKNDDDQADMGG